MNDIEVSSIDLVEGGNVFKQGHYLTLGYVPRDEKGETVDLSGKTLNVALWGRKGVVFEAAATYSAGVIRFTLDKLVPAGDYTVEFTVTSSADAKYRKKFPTNQHSGRIAIKQSADDLGVVGIQVYTVAQLKAEQKALLDAAVSGFTVDSETKMARVSGTTTHPTIGARLEADKQVLAAQLAETVKHGEISVADIDKSKGLLDQTFMTDEFKGQFINNTLPINATPANKSLTSVKYANKSVGVKTVDFVEESSNLYDIATVVSGSLSVTTGELGASETYFSTPFIPIDGGAQYTVTELNRIVYYDAEFKFIKAEQSVTYPHTYTAPANAFFARFSASTLALASKAQINRGGSLLSPEPYYIKLKKLRMDGQAILNESIQPDKLGFIKKSSNLYNPKTVSLNTVISADGTETASNENAVSDFIVVSPNTVYTLKDAHTTVFYTKDKQFISRPYNQGTFTTPSTAYWCKLSLAVPYSMFLSFITQ